MREDPEKIILVEVPALHYRLAIAFLSLKPQELVDTHLAYDVGEECQRELAKRMESYDATDPRIHLLDRKIGMTAAESVYKMT